MRPISRSHATRRDDPTRLATAFVASGYWDRDGGQHLVNRALSGVSGGEPTQVSGFDQLRAESHHVLRRQLADLGQLI